MRRHVLLSSLAACLLACGLPMPLGPAAPATITLSAAEPAGTNCPYGGTVTRVGADRNGNTALDAEEVTSVSYSCANAPGGGGGGGMGSGCTASNCNGCCTTAGECRSGRSVDACGLYGVACATCGASEVCTDHGVCFDGPGGDGGSLPALCSRSNCSGCCDADGVCQLGNTSDACGVDANACVACAASQSCSAAGACTSGGSATTDGGTSCSPSNCTGCCLNNQCVSGSLVSACGRQGQVCSACPGGQECAQGVCQPPPTCNGCKDLLNNCKPGTAVSACGSAGAQCKTCSSGQSCINGACVGCDGSSCPDGCCNGTTCVSGASLSAAKCGMAGQSCTACVNGATCNLSSQGGTCSGGTGGGMGGGSGGGFGGGFGGGSGGGFDGGLSGCTTCTDASGACVSQMDDLNCNLDLMSALSATTGTALPCEACPSGTSCQAGFLGEYCQ